MAEYNPSKIIKDGNTYNFRDDTKIPLAGSNAISGSLIPATTDAYDLGGPSYQWNNAYIKSLTINGVACGDILTHNASEFVDVSSDQTIGGSKVFSGNFSVNRPSPRLQTKSTTYSSETSSGMTIGEIAFLNNNGGFSAWIIHQLRDNLTKRICFRVHPHPDGSYKGFAFDDSCNLYPENINSAIGTSTNKWKLINGINPGALSLPSNSYVNVDTTNWDLTCQNELMGSFTPTADGWLMLHVANSGPSEVNFWVIGGVIRINNKSTLNTSDNNSFNMITIPVEKDVTYNIYGNASEYVAGRSIAYCRFMPCRGNV